MSAISHCYCCSPGFLFPTLCFEERLDAVAASGINRVELWARTDRFADVDVDVDQPGKVLVAAAQRGLSVSSIGAQASRDPSEIEKILRFASDAGAEIMVLSSKGKSFDEFLDSLRALQGLARKLGVQVAVFNHVKGLLQSKEDMEALCSGVDASIVGLSLAPTHAVVLGEDPLDLIASFRSRILQVWLWDLLQGVRQPLRWMDAVYTRGEEQFPGRGELPFDEYMKLMVRLGLTPQLNFLPHGVQDWPAEETVKALRASIKWLEKSLIV